MKSITLYCGPYEIAPTKPHNDRYGRHGVGAFSKTSGSNLLQKLFIEAILSILDFSVSSGGPPLTSDTPPKTNNWKHQFQDVSPIKIGWFSIVMLFSGVINRFLPKTMFFFNPLQNPQAFFIEGSSSPSPPPTLHSLALRLHGSPRKKPPAHRKKKPLGYWELLNDLLATSG